MNRQRFLAGYAYAAGILGWVALLLQFQLHMRGAQAQGNSTGVALLNFFSYFTILANILVALAFTAPRLLGKTSAGKFFARAEIHHGIAVCIAIVGIVYNTVLRGIWNPQGMQYVVDNLLHVVMPLLFLAYWFLAVPRKSWSGRAILRGALFPLLYLLLSLARGAADAWYPYPFLNAEMLGYPRVLLNSLGVLVLFTAVALLLFVLDRFKPGLKKAA